MSVSINGFGRIGRGVLRALFERGLFDSMPVLHINEPAPIETIGHLLKYDTTYGRFPGEVEVQAGQLVVNGHVIQVTHERVLSNVDWPTDTVLECSGQYSAQELRRISSNREGRRFIISNPANKDVDATVIYGLNHQRLNGQETLISCGSCTSNALIPVLSIMDEVFGIESGSSLTIHSAMHDQPVIDAYHDVDLRLTRSALHSVIPVDTKLHLGVYRVLPQLAGVLDSFSVRVPTTTVSAIDLSLNLKSDCSSKSLISTLRKLSDQIPCIFGLSEAPLASSDFSHDARSGIIDVNQTRSVTERYVKIFIWFDNEWGYSNRLVDTALFIERIAQ